jgi:hypothetical protein
LIFLQSHWEDSVLRQFLNQTILLNPFSTVVTSFRVTPFAVHVLWLDPFIPQVNKHIGKCPIRFKTVMLSSMLLLFAIPFTDYENDLNDKPTARRDGTRNAIA